MKRTFVMIRLLLVILFTVSVFDLKGQTLTTERQKDILGQHSLTLPAPIVRWDNALPLGNGLTGGLLWGEGSELRLSLDRGDLWDERGNADVYSPKRTFATLLDAVAKKDKGTWKKYFDSTYHSNWTKLPGGRLSVDLPKGRKSSSFNLEFEKAIGTVKLDDNTEVKAFFSAVTPVALLRLPKGSKFRLHRLDILDRMRYPAPVWNKTENEISYTQKTLEQLEYAVVVRWEEKSDYLLAVVAITSNVEDKDPLMLARKRIDEAFKEGWKDMLASHQSWWKDFYNTSSVMIPNPRLQHHYNLVKYLYGSGSRAHASPMPLQGVWTADEGKLPPWKGDYHNDLNTQMTYVAWQAAGLVESGMAYMNFYWSRLPQFRKYGKEFFGVKGAMVPGVMTLKGQAMGGWPQYAMSLTAGIWNGHAFYQHWKITQDREFLAERAYPWLAEVVESVFSLGTEKEGKLKLPVSTSPEWNEGEWSAYLIPQSNFDQTLLLWSTKALEEMATKLGKKDDARKWAARHSKLEPLIFDKETGGLLVAKDAPFSHTHRHFSHTLAIHPLGILNVDQSEEARKAVLASIEQIKSKKTGYWVGYSFAWMGGLSARAGQGDEAERFLNLFERAFVTRNGFHVNGDQTRSGLSKFKYRPFTLEGNFLVMDAVQEMCMQSFGDKVKVFPAIPESWKDVSFRDLCAEGGFKISAVRRDGITQEVTVTAVCESELRIRDPFGGEGKWSMKHKQEDDCLIFKMDKDKTLKGSRTK